MQVWPGGKKGSNFEWLSFPSWVQKLIEGKYSDKGDTGSQGFQVLQKLWGHLGCPSSLGEFKELEETLPKRQTEAWRSKHRVK